MARLYGPTPGSPPPLVSTADLAGLSASDVEGSPIGELVGALSEESTGMIRYLDVSIREADKHVLVPIGHARIDRESVPPRIRLRAATYDDLMSVPAFDEEELPIGSGYQEELMSAHGRIFYGSYYYAHPAYDHTALRAGDAPIVSAAPAEGEGLRSLSELKERRPSRALSDLVGWSAEDTDGEDVGVVADLLFERSGKRVRYLVLALDSPERQTVLPVGYVEVDRKAERVRATALTIEDITLLPPYDPPLTRAEENRLQAAIEGRLSGPRYFERVDFRRPPDDLFG